MDQAGSANVGAGSQLSTSRSISTKSVFWGLDCGDTTTGCTFGTSSASTVRCKSASAWCTTSGASSETLMLQVASLNVALTWRTSYSCRSAVIASSSAILCLSSTSTAPTWSTSATALVTSFSTSGLWEINRERISSLLFSRNRFEFAIVNNFSVTYLRSN